MIAAKEVTSLRTRTGMSQAVFARVLNVSTKTVQSWEQGERKPSHAALRMLQVFRENPNYVFRIVGIPAECRGHARAPRLSAPPAPSPTAHFLFRRHGHQFLAHGLDLLGGNRRPLFGKTDQQRQIAEAIDLPGHAVREFLQGRVGRGLEDLPVRARPRAGDGRRRPPFPPR